ncbi:MAG: right-handed parallel beta-helix repeat-containing protein, partial [Salinisphaera sp.]|nr:right-handed parallel beta-helix repeat-containing protein [Salinisphaera sp.]
GNLAGVYQDVPDDIGEGTHREPSDTAPAADGGALYITAGADVTITKGDAPLALISSNQATGSGGGIYNEGNLTIRNTQIQFNEALVLGTRTSPGGGQIYNTGGSVDLEQVLMNNGEATGDRPEGAGEDNTGMGGAILSSGGELTVNLSQVQSNLAGAAGGAIALIDGAMATITRSAFASNAAVGNATAARGGAIYANAAADLTIKLSSMNLNQGGTEGGAMWLHDTDATLAAVSIRNNTAPDGGGIYLSGASTVTVNDSQLLRNVAQNVPETDSDPVTGSGGAILNDGATLVVNGSLISRNSAADSGAGIYTTGGGTTSLVDTVVGGDDPEDGNMTGTDPGQGGGLYVDDGTLTIDRSTIAFNTASQGGGIWAGNLATVIAANSTISNNQATGGESTANGDGGGIFQTAGGSTTLTYSTVAENSANGDGGGLAVGGSTAASIFLNSSIVSANQANGLDDDFADNGSVVASNSVVRAADAGLQDLQLFGGPTATYPLTATSQALDIGDPSTCSAPPVSSLDQRGAVRPIDGNDDATAACDAGSFERNPGLPRLDVSSNGPPVTGIDLGNGETLTNGIVLLAVSLHNPSTTEGVTVASFNARPYFNANLQLQSGGLLTGVGLLRNLLPPDFDSDSSSIDFQVIKDVDGDGKLDPEDVQSVGEDVDDLGTEFTFGSGGLHIPPGGEQDLLVVVRVPDAAPVTSNGYPVTPWYAGGMLLALFGVFGLGGIRQRSRWILAVLVIAVGLAACSKGDDEPPPDFTFFGDPALQGLLRYELIALKTTSGAPIVAPDLPVYGPVISN